MTDDRLFDLAWWWVQFAQTTANLIALWQILKPIREGAELLFMAGCERARTGKE